jgi:hypothetical protein
MTFRFISRSEKNDCLSREERNCFISSSEKNDFLFHLLVRIDCLFVERMTELFHFLFRKE